MHGHGKLRTKTPVSPDRTLCTLWPGCPSECRVIGTSLFAQGRGGALLSSHPLHTLSHTQDTSRMQYSRKVIVRGGGGGVGVWPPTLECNSSSVGVRREYVKYEKNMRVWNTSCGGMRASTVRCRFLDRCGDSLGVEISFKDICILAAVSNTRCRM